MRGCIPLTVPTGVFYNKSCWVPSGQRLAVLGSDGVLLILKLTQCHEKKMQITAEEDGDDLEGSKCVDGRWQAEPLGFTTTPEPLTRLIWEHPALLLGLAGDAAILALTGLEQLSSQPGKSGIIEAVNKRLVGGAAALDAGQKLHTGSTNEDGACSEDMSSDYTGDDGAQEEESDSPDRETRNGATLPQLKSESALSVAEDPLDLTQVLFFRQGQRDVRQSWQWPFIEILAGVGSSIEDLPPRIDVKIPNSVLRSIIPDGKDPREQEELNGSDSEADTGSDQDTASSVASREAHPRVDSSSGSLAEQSAAADETRRVLAAAMKQQQRRRAAAAAAAAAAARLTAITIAGLEWCTTAPGLLRWGNSGSELSSSNGPASGNDEEEWKLEGSFLIFSGTSTLRNGIWCTPLETLSTPETPGLPGVTPAASITARPLLSLFNVLQQLNNEKSESATCEIPGPHVTQLLVVPERRFLLTGTSDGRVIMFPADTPNACVAARVFDSHVGSVTSIIIKQMDSTNRWALVAAAQSGAWWRCEFEYDIIRSRCKEAEDTEGGSETTGPAKTHEDRAEAQKALRCGATQQAEKHQQQQQFLRRLLMLDATAYDDQTTNEVAEAANGLTPKKTKEPKTPCPHPVPIDNLLQVASNESESFDANPPTAAEDVLDIAATMDPAKDIVDPEEPTIMDLITRLKALPGVNTQEMMMNLILREDLHQADEAEAAKSLERVERLIQGAVEQHRALINTLARLFGGALEAVTVAGIFDSLCDIERLQAAGQAQCTPRGAADMQAILEAAREKELRDLLLPEQTVASCTPSSNRRPTVEAETMKASKIQEIDIPGICNGPGSLLALTLQSGDVTGAAGWHARAAPSTDARRQRMLEMATLLKAQPKEDYTNAQDEQRITETIKNLNAYNLTNSRTMTEASLTMTSRKKKQMLELAEWASAKAYSFNRRVKVLSQMRKELLRASVSILREISEALQSVELQDSTEFLQVQSLTKAVESATAEEQSNGSLWSVSKEQLIHSLEGRLKELKNTGALFETEASKAEIEEVTTALAAARLRPDEFVMSFEHLRPVVGTLAKGEQDFMLEREACFAGLSGAQVDTSASRCPSAASSKDRKLKERLMGLVHGLRACEMSQSCTVQRALNLQECSKIYEHYYADDSVNSDSLSSTCRSWATLQSMEIRLQANKSIETIKYAVDAFDKELRELLKDRTALHQQLLLARLKQLEQVQELCVIESVEPRNLRLQQDLSSEQKECQQINGRLEALDASIAERIQGIENCRVGIATCATELEIRRRVAETIGPRNPQQAALMQIFERNVVHKTTKPSASPRGVDAEASDLEDEAEEAEQMQANSGDVEEDICPLGCDMAVYEALLEFRDQKTANDATLTLQQRELDELKREQAKVQGIQKQHAARYKSVEAAIHKFLKELQSSLNELETVVPLRASQIKCLSPVEERWQLPDKLDSAVIFSNEGFSALRQQVAELQRETSIVADDLKQLKRLLGTAQRENKQSSQRLATLRATFKAVELVRFGVSLTLEQVEAAAVAAGHEDKQTRSEPVRPAFERDMEMVAAKQAQLKHHQQHYMQLKHKLREVTRRHTDLLHRFASARESETILTQQLQGEKRHRNTSDDGTFARMRLEELGRLKDMLRKSEGEIERLQALIIRMKTKGKLVKTEYPFVSCSAHVEPTILWRRDPQVFYE
ncbi:WD domain-containing protein, putative [Eimeria praecox]|uniref:WD domain-containing protein, putative n=1 Tax=Eimeria praecox TaxID=51316 RepID=U6GSJ5_9EIME|nr:WD domain-containing protein, putative [Eimeria praecox]